MTDAQLKLMLRAIIAELDKRAFDDTTAIECAKIRRAASNCRESYLLLCDVDPEVLKVQVKL